MSDVMQRQDMSPILPRKGEVAPKATEGEVANTNE